MKTHLFAEPIPYTGSELRPHWIYEHTGLLGDAAVAFTGPCQVDVDKLVDWEDRRREAFIYSPEMLHILVELFHTPLLTAVCFQRLIIVLIQETLVATCEAQGLSLQIVRRGDDLYINETQKLSVSIATASPVSSLIHVGVNIQTEGTPVSTAGLLETLNISNRQTLKPFIEGLLETIQQEWTSIQRASCKVRPVV